VDRIALARARWHAAEDRLYPTLLADPAAYQRVVVAVQAVVDELRRRGAQVGDLVTVETAPDELIGAACPSGIPVPADLLVAVACALRDRELATQQATLRRDEAVAAARRAGAEWAVLDGPAAAADLVEGRRVAMHIATGTLVESSVDPWSGEEPYRLTVVPGESHTFTDRDAWLAELYRIEQSVGGDRQDR
jgi:hypothetical protein